MFSTLNLNKFFYTQLIIGTFRKRTESSFLFVCLFCCWYYYFAKLIVLFFAVDLTCGRVKITVDCVAKFVPPMRYSQQWSLKARLTDSVLTSAELTTSSNPKVTHPLFRFLLAARVRQSSRLALLFVCLFGSILVFLNLCWKKIKIFFYPVERRPPVRSSVIGCCSDFTFVGSTFWREM